MDPSRKLKLRYLMGVWINDLNTDEYDIISNIFDNIHQNSEIEKSYLQRLDAIYQKYRKSKKNLEIQ